MDHSIGDDSIPSIGRQKTKLSMELSIIIPVFNEEDNIEIIFTSVKQQMEEKINISWELIFVDDGSKDGSWKKILGLSSLNTEIQALRFSRNFGHQYALKAGMDRARGKAVITMDADMQHPPALIEDLFLKWKEGFHIVNAIRMNTKGVGFGKKISSHFFYKIMNYLSDIRIEDGASDFRLVDRKVIEQFKEMNEYFLFLRGIISWIGFKTASIEYIADERYSGRSKYSLKKMLHFASDGIMGFSIKPLRLATLLGFVISTFAFAYIVYAIIAKFFLHNTLSGWASLLISILLIGGIQLLTIGIIGEYIGKIFIEIKKRPQYIISDKIENQTDS